MLPATTTKGVTGRLRKSTILKILKKVLDSQLNLKLAEKSGSICVKNFELSVQV